MASEATEHREEEEEVIAGEDEDTGAQIAPIVKLEEVAITTGEEDENVILDLKAKLYRFETQWKERGTGTIKLLKHRETGKVRLVMRQSKTLKICANHYVLPTMSVQEHAGNEKSCVWHAADFADGEVKDETFCVRFPSIENCKSFMETIQEIAESQVSKGEEEDKDALAAAELVEKLSFVEKDEKKSSEEAPVTVTVKENEAEKEAAKEEEGKKEPDTAAA
ncbi:ran-binding protein 1 homolog a-like [Impatiens glandulifera]|uniref:ran-binding protein 1 homolog a-like n=1 Tax=Impatiens glandulifera TaxID=253017 RepID=UPI001FB097BE|nr:ran-binding protein 1 homolog a-like [Impatiens glandulifera]